MFKRKKKKEIYTENICFLLRHCQSIKLSKHSNHAKLKVQPLHHRNYLQCLMYEKHHITFLVNELIYICVMMQEVRLLFHLHKFSFSFLNALFVDGRSCYPELKGGGALQVSIQGFQVDYYPFHLAKTDRSHWPK